MSDTPFPIPDGAATRVLAAFDAEGKIPRAIEALGPIEGRDVVLVDAGPAGVRVRQLADLGGRVTALTAPEHADALREAVADLGDRVRVASGTAAATGLGDAEADTVVSFWEGYRPPADDAVAEADRILRPDGRLLLVRDYGRDDHVRAEPAVADDLLAWSRRDGWYLTHGFRVRVIHAFWTFTDLDEAREVLETTFGAGGAALAAGLTRARISHNVAVYHRNRGGVGPSPVVRPDREERRADRGARNGPGGAAGARNGPGAAGPVPSPDEGA